MDLLAPPSVLIVDDDVNVRTSVRICLEEAGYQVRQACDGTEALEQIYSNKPDVVLLDLAMPVFDGLSVLAEMMNLWPHFSNRVVVLTGTATVATAVEAMQLGASDVLQKPVLPTDLRRAVAAAFEDWPTVYIEHGKRRIHGFLQVRDAPVAHTHSVSQRRARKLAMEIELLPPEVDDISHAVPSWVT